MTEIKKTLAILKARWPEVTLIISINLLPVLSTTMLSRIKGPKLIQIFSWSYSIFQLISILMLTTLRSGFLRTVYLEGQKRQPIAVLLRTGLHFLWRMFVLGLLYRIPLLTLTSLITHLAVKQAAPGETDTLHNIILTCQLLILVINIVLMKLILLLPALVVVLDCSVFESFKFLKKCRLRDSRELMVAFCFAMAFPFLWMFLRTLYGTAISLHLIFRIVPSIAMCFIGLIVAVMAVRFVASLHLGYDDSLSSSGAA